MKASELIQKLNDQIALWGDLEVEICPIHQGHNACHCSRPIRDNVGSDGEICIYLDCYVDDVVDGYLERAAKEEVEE